MSGFERGRHDDRGHVHDAAAERRGAMTSRVAAVLATLEAAGIATAADIDGVIDRFLTGAGPANGARVVARAWINDGFRRRLLADANAAIAELAIDLSHWAPVRLRAVENTPGVHNVVVCTLCSCYPIALLGPSPSWYKSEAYRSRVVREPRAVLREFGCDVPPDVELRVWDSTAELRYLVVPQRPAGTQACDEAQLAARVTRDALIGVARTL